MKNNIYLGVFMTPRQYFQLSILLVICTYVILFYNRLESPYKKLGILIGISFASELTARLLAINTNNSNLAYHLLIPILIWFFYLIYKELIRFNKNIQRAFMLWSFLIIVFSIINSLYIQELHRFPSYSMSLLSLTVVMYSLILFRKILLIPNEQPLYKQDLFWFNISNFLFYALTFFVFTFFEFILRHYKLNFEWVMDLVYLLGIILYVGYFIALYLNRKKNEYGI